MRGCCGLLGFPWFTPIGRVGVVSRVSIAVSICGCGLVCSACTVFVNGSVGGLSALCRSLGTARARFFSFGMPCFSCITTGGVSVAGCVEWGVGRRIVGIIGGVVGVIMRHETGVRRVCCGRCSVRLSIRGWRSSRPGWRYRLGNSRNGLRNGGRGS